jgi:hypothetical protein
MEGDAHWILRNGMAVQVEPTEPLLKARGIEPSLRFFTSVAEGPHVIGRELTGILSTNHMRAFSH